MEDVINAINILYGSSLPNEKKKADNWLREWQLSYNAWDTCNKLLSDKSLDHTIHHFSAITIRTKLLYDFYQLDESSHEILSKELLNHLYRFKEPEFKSIFISLASAFADLTIHLALKWPNFVDTLHLHFNQLDDSLLFVKTLKVIPEENYRDQILVDSSALNAHTNIICSHILWVLSWLENALNVLDFRETSVLEIVECAVEWFKFYLSKKGHTEKVILPIKIIDCIFQLIGSVDQLSSSRALQCLTTSIDLASRFPDIHAGLLDKTMQELASPNGSIRSILIIAIESNDFESLVQLCRIYCYSCTACRDKIVQSLGQGNPVVNEIISILIKLTSVSYNPFDESLAYNGVASTILYFWSKFCISISSQRIKANENQEKMLLENNNQKSLIQESVIQEQNNIFMMLMHALLQHCTIPVDLLNKTDTSLDDLDDYFRFRDNVTQLIAQLQLIFPIDQIILHILDSLASIQNNDENIIKLLQESHISCLSGIINYAEISQNKYDLCSNQSSDKFNENKNILSNSRSKMIDSLSQLILNMGNQLGCSVPETLLDCYIRISSIQLINEVMRSFLVVEKPAEMQLLALMISKEVFNTNMLLLSDNTKQSDPSSQSFKSIIIKIRKELVLEASESLKLFCFWSEDTLTLDFLLRHLFQELTKAPNLKEKIYQKILSGVSYIVGNLEDENYFIQWNEAIINEVLNIIWATKDIVVIANNLDRISLFLVSLSHEKMIPSRRKVVADIINRKVWPLLCHLMQKEKNSSILIEHSGRLLKHTMRSIRGDLFKLFLSPLIAILTENSKETIYPTYLYIAEWLITEYYDDNEVLGILSTFFTQLTSCTNDYLNTVFSLNKIDDEVWLVDDYFSMFSRYLKFSPKLVVESNTLSRIYEQVPKCLGIRNSSVLTSVCIFLENVAYLVRMNLPENVDISNSLDLHDHRQGFIQLFVKHRNEIIRTLFLVIQLLTDYSSVNMIVGVITEYQKCTNPDEFSLALSEALNSLPPIITINDKFKESIIRRIQSGSIKDPLFDLFDRYKHVLYHDSCFVQAK